MPAVTSARLTRPSIGAVIRVKLRFRRAASSCAWVAATAALASWAAVVRASASSAEIALLGAQAFAALGFVDAPRLGRAGLLQLGFEALDLGLERARVDLEQQVAFLHQCAFMEGHAVDVARHPRAQLHRLRGLQAAGEFVPLVQRLFDDFGDADLGRRHALGGFRGLAAGAQDQYGRECEGVAPGEVG